MKATHFWPLALLAAALTPAARAQGADPAFFPITPCALADASSADRLAGGAPRVFPVHIEGCPIPDDATAVLIEVRAIAPSAPARLVATGGGRSPAEATVFHVDAGGGSATTVVPLHPALPAVLGVQADFTGGAGTTAIALSVVGYFEQVTAFDGTTGFITTRPTCVPPKYKPDTLNYLQGPEPVQLANGDVTLLVGAGRCCVGTRHWEGLFSLTYPGAGRAAAPRFRPLWATNDFSNLPKRKEAELGFPSAVFYGGKWRLGLTTTFLPFHRPNSDRMSRIDTADLMTRVVPGQVVNTWIKPIAPACQQTGTCQGRGSGLDPVLTLHPNGDLYAYHRDGNYPACASGYVRHKVAANLTVNNTRDDGCVRFEGLAVAPYFVSDIGRTAEGEMRLLVEKLEGPGFIAEWSSTGGPAEIGLLWRPTGRVWPAPAHALGHPWAYYARDAAFLKRPDRTIVEPTVVVGLVSDGRTYQEMATASLGRYHLYYWADQGATLPPTFGGKASSCALQGVQESSDCTAIRGWAWDPVSPNTPISVDVLVDGVFAQTIAADLPRPDLAAAGRGDGRHGFSWPIPAALRNGRAHKVTVRFAESVDSLSGKPKAITCR